MLRRRHRVRRCVLVRWHTVTTAAAAAANRSKTMDATAPSSRTLTSDEVISPRRSVAPFRPSLHKTRDRIMPGKTSAAMQKPRDRCRWLETLASRIRTRNLKQREKQTKEDEEKAVEENVIEAMDAKEAGQKAVGGVKEHERKKSVTAWIRFFSTTIRPRPPNRPVRQRRVAFSGVHLAAGAGWPKAKGA